MNHNATFKGTKIVINSLQPSCDAQDTAICRQVDQKGHKSQHFVDFVILLLFVVGIRVSPLWPNLGRATPHGRGRIGPFKKPM